jgi:hypothetical protein
VKAMSGMAKQSQAQMGSTGTVLAASVMPAVAAMGLMFSGEAESGLREQLLARRG